VTAAALVRPAGAAVRLAIEAMATRFELVLAGGDPVRLHAAGEEALAEIARLDAQLSAYRASSDVSWINTHAFEHPVQVEPGLFRLLARCQQLCSETDGAFDVTVGSLMRAWRFAGGRGSVPSDAVRGAARTAAGPAVMRLDPAASTVSFTHPAARIDLGAVGKGYAIDCAIGLLREQRVTCALLHGGTSSVHAIGAPPDQSGWRISWRPSGGRATVVSLRDAALATSAVYGKSFRAGGREYGHVLDPRSGAPTEAARAARVTGPRSLECDALSTALLVAGASWLPVLRQRFPECHGDVASNEPALDGRRAV
jgi:FAD:protein FMN transferase